MQRIFDYDVFLSFASKDEDLVKPIWQEMCLSGLRVFWSDETLKQNIGQQFFSVIQNALIQSNHFVLICSQYAMESKWVELEYQTFYSECFIKSNGIRRLIILPIRNFDVSILPPFLKSLQFAKSVEQMIFTFGGIDIQKVKAENVELKQKLEQIVTENKRLNEELRENKAALVQPPPIADASEKAHYQALFAKYENRIRELESLLSERSKVDPDNPSHKDVHPKVKSLNAIDNDTVKQPSKEPDNSPILVKSLFYTNRSLRIWGPPLFVTVLLALFNQIDFGSRYDDVAFRVSVLFVLITLGGSMDQSNF